MPIIVRCACGKEYQFKDEYAGRRAKCPVCGQVVRIPGTRLPGTPMPHRPSRGASPEGEQSRTVILAALGFAGFVILVGIGLVVYFLFFSGPAPRAAKPAAPSPATQQPSVAASEGPVPASGPSAPAAAPEAEPASVPAPSPTAGPVPPPPPAPPAPAAAEPGSLPAAASEGPASAPAPSPAGDKHTGVIQEVFEEGLAFHISDAETGPIVYNVLSGWIAQRRVRFKRNPQAKVTTATLVAQLRLKCSDGILILSTFIPKGIGMSNSDQEGTAIANILFPAPGDLFFPSFSDYVKKGCVETTIWLVPEDTKPEQSFKVKLSNEITLPVK